jgi:Amidase
MLIRTGQLSSVEVVEAILRRIDALEASLHSGVTIDREAVLAQARQCDEEWRQSGPRGLLHGIPVGCKDILYTAGLKTTACSRVYAEFVPAYDATAVSRLKQAGAIILGKTVCSAHLARLSRALLERQDLALVYFPVSIRFRTNLASVVFPALAARLASLHEDKVSTDLKRILCVVTRRAAVFACVVVDLWLWCPLLPQRPVHLVQEESRVTGRFFREAMRDRCVFTDR